MKNSQYQSGFTLVELLVVIGIIAVLIAILLPTLRKVRQQANSAVCASNLRQWSQAVNQYALEYQNWLPRRGQGQQPTMVLDRPEDWFNALPVMMQLPTYQKLVTDNRMPTVDSGGIFICPEFKGLPNGGGYLFTYSMNMRLSTWITSVPDKINKVGSPSTMVFMTDGPGGYCSVLPMNAKFSPAARHNNYINIAFLDGHVAAFTGDYVGCGVGDPQRNDVRWLVPNSPWAGPSPN